MKPNKITQKDIAALETLKRKAIRNQWYETAAHIRDIQSRLAENVKRDDIDRMLGVISMESLRRVCPNGHHYTAIDVQFECPDMCPKCIREKTKKQQTNNN